MNYNLIFSPIYVICEYRDCLQFCFMHLIQKELDAIAHEWNTHRIRADKNRLVPAGIPNELYSSTRFGGMKLCTCLYSTIYCVGTCNYLCDVNRRDLHVCRNYAEEPDPPAPLSFLQAANELIVQRGLEFPQTVGDAMSMYAELVTLIIDGY